MDDAIRNVFRYAGMQNTIELESRFLRGSLTLGASKGEGYSLRAVMNERMVIVQKGDSTVGRSM